MSTLVTKRVEEGVFEPPGSRFTMFLDRDDQSIYANDEMLREYCPEALHCSALRQITIPSAIDVFIYKQDGPKFSIITLVDPGVEVVQIVKFESPPLTRIEIKTLRDGVDSVERIAIRIHPEVS